MATSQLDIYSLLKLKQHNPHYLKRYYNFIMSCNILNMNIHYEYTEKHHILPVSIWPEYKKLKSNKIILSARQHFIAHYILAKCFANKNETNKMVKAFIMMKTTNAHQRYFNSRLYNIFRIEFANIMSETQRGSNNSQYGKLWVVSKENIVLRIQKEELKSYIDIGWQQGKIWKKIRTADPIMCAIKSKLPFSNVSFCKLCGKCFHKTKSSYCSSICLSVIKSFNSSKRKDRISKENPLL